MPFWREELTVIVLAKYRKKNPNPFETPLPRNSGRIDAELTPEQLPQAEALARAACPDGFVFVELVEVVDGAERPFRVPCPA